jgi:pyruvate,water dikinase
VISGGGLAAAGPQEIGGKAANLVRLVRAGQTVPPFYVVTAAAFRHALRGHELRPSGNGSAFQESIRSLALPADVVDALRQAHRTSGLERAHVAVRSSAVDEDGAGASFAGLHDSVLFVRGEEGLLAALRRVWASAYNERALAYRRQRGLSLDDVAVAVVVQEMVGARASGVVFTADPVSGSLHRIVISALYGAGEGLVSAGLDADTFEVDKDTLAATPRLARKEEQLVLDVEAGTGLRRVPVAAERQDASCLTDDEVRRVARMSLAIEAHFGRPQDIEFSLDAKGTLHALQSRPVTTVDEYGPAAGHHLLWDNSNITESYSGTTSPMTFSFIRRAYTIVYHCFAEVMGIAPEVVRRNQDTFENMLGLIRGRVYYNLLNWYRVVRLFPGFQYNKRFMESMMGVQEPAELRDEIPAPTFRRRYLVELPALVRLLVRSSWNFYTLERRVEEFQARFKQNYERWSRLDFSGLKPQELRALYRQMEDALLWNWKAPIINDFYVMILYGTLKRLCVTWCGDKSGSLQNDLICGEGGIESTEPTKMLLRLAAAAQQDPALRDRILGEAPDVLAREIPRDPRFTSFTADVGRYLDLYGFRCMNELKLEELSLRDRPDFLYQVLRNYLALGNASSLDVTAMESRERRIRAEAEQRAFGHIDGLPWGFLKRAVFARVLDGARSGVRNRENMRFARTRIYGVVRELIRALGRHLAAEKILDSPEDVFHLSLDEVWDYTKGTAITTDLRALAALRRQEFDGYRHGEEPDDRFETYGMVYHRNRFQNRRLPDPVPLDGVLRGTGCCPGEITGPVKVLRTPKDDMRLSGEILVAERTDPGWVPLYPSISGLLIERGSILSHSAIVAREMGIPTIVGIPCLIATLRDGDVVHMNGSAGTAAVVPSATPASMAGKGPAAEPTPPTPRPGASPSGAAS